MYFLNFNNTSFQSRFILHGIRLLLFILPLFIFSDICEGKVRISNKFSPLNQRRPARPHTEFIVLHTTEASTESALRKIHKNGEAHYFVKPDGHVYRIIAKWRIAKHAGRSMWNNKTDIDLYSIGIEVVGYHNKHITKAQYRALKWLINELQSQYAIPDENVITHSMVAYSRNKWFDFQRARGRKKCGMMFAIPEVRQKLGLKSKKSLDPDVKSGRVVVGDKNLARVLYGRFKANIAEAFSKFTGRNANVITEERTAWQIAGNEYNQKNTKYEFPNGKIIVGNKVKNWGELPLGTRVHVSKNFRSEVTSFEGFQMVGEQGKHTAWSIAGAAYKDRTTIYFFPGGRIKTGSELYSSKEGRLRLNRLPVGTKVLVGYVYGGRITGKTTPFKVCGNKWNYPSTFYRLPNGEIKTGDNINAKEIPKKTEIFYMA